MSIRFEDLSLRAQRQAMEQLGREKVKRAAKVIRMKQRNKFGNEITDRGNIRFHSRKEARRYEQLSAMERAGQIRGLRLQQTFTLQEAYTTPSGERVRAIRYLADFAYERATAPDCAGTVYWLPVVEDVKSRPTRTKDYIIKKKLMQDKLGITIQEV